MPKRPCPTDDENDDHIAKKQITELKSAIKTRDIRSLTAEKTLQMLYKGASKAFDIKKEALKSNCSSCVTTSDTVSLCGYCDRKLCLNCASLCHECHRQYCPQCSFQTYDERVSVCYSCYT